MNADIKEVDIATAWQQVRELIVSCDAHRGGIGQVALGKECGVSQGTISRLAAKQPTKWGGGFIRLFRYASRRSSSRKRRDPSTSFVLVAALEEVWNGTDEHAEALAAIIRATADAARAVNL